MPAANPMRVMLDGTPLLGPRTGIGGYTAHLIRALAARSDVAVTVTAFTARGYRSLPGELPPGVHRRQLPVPARALRRLWRRWSWPPVEFLAGPAAVFHGTNFILPPTLRAAGVVTVHDLAHLEHADTLHPDNADLATLVARGLRRARAVCAPTAAVATALRTRYDLPADRLFVTPLGVDPGWFTASAPDRALRERLGLPDRYFVFVGTQEPRKGLDVLLAAHRRLCDDATAPGLVLAGPAGWGPVVVDQEPVTRTGYLAPDDLRAVVAGATALVLPSRDEGFGLPVIEAFGAGVPVIISEIPALMETAGGLAVAVPSGDPEALAAALGDLAGRTAPLIDRAARRAWAATFTWARCAETTLAAYRYAANG